ncbi:MAG: hypothetical protein PHW11_02910 [Anaerolineaceae bacterium]|jgi:hypothetical protein|nr:hypothetical protein [Anaerolineaceae bacterium]MDD4042358.1 hypothetical protein [Anaerolineaceae bacterium]MDD4577404.1 hypothetical protein [Anaerolineaceae bacterium]
MENIGDLFGRIVLIGVIYLALRLVLVWIVNTIRKQGKTLPDWLKKVLQFVNKTHRYVGFFSAGLVIVHATLQIGYYDLVPPAGVIAGTLLVTQAGLGFWLTKNKNKDRRKKLVLWHRIVGLALVVAVLAHRISGSLRNPQPK